jgi:hypothetical protein
MGQHSRAQIFAIFNFAQNHGHHPPPSPLSSIEQMLFPNECLRKGLGLLNYTDKEIDRVFNRTNLERFSSHYGPFPTAAIVAVLNDNLHIHRKHLFMTLHWWKSYDTEHEMESRWKYHPETIRNIVFDVCCQLAKRKSDKIVLADFEPLQVFLASIDCIHCEIQEVRTSPDSKWYSQKFSGPGFSYEVCVDILKDRIVWVNGPFPAATHDITIFRGGTKKLVNTHGVNLAYITKCHLGKD